MSLFFLGHLLRLPGHRRIIANLPGEFLGLFAFFYGSNLQVTFIPSNPIPLASISPHSDFNCKGAGKCLVMCQEEMETGLLTIQPSHHKSAIWKTLQDNGHLYLSTGTTRMFGSQ
jgi:hypothetical protein